MAAKVQVQDVVALLKKAALLVPPLSRSTYKGQCGRIAVVGGCLEYTGAPYFAAITALKMGAELSHVFCDVDAGTSIKSYSPELIVHPIFQHGADHAASAERVAQWFNRLSCIVIGPGLGQSETMQKSAAIVIERARKANIPLVLDGDAIRIVCEDPALISGYKWCFLTPNLVEMKRLCKSILKKDIELPKSSPFSVSASALAADVAADDLSIVQELADKLGGVTVLRKHAIDIASDGTSTDSHANTNTYCCTESSSPRRCGGQGDLTAGSVAVFLSWCKTIYDDPSAMASIGSDVNVNVPLAAWSGALFTRKCSESAFKKKGRSMVASDMIKEIGQVFSHLFEA